MRELTEAEINQVDGGLEGTVIPFTSSYLQVSNWPGGFPNAIAMGWLSAQAGYVIGSVIYNSIEDYYGMSTGEAAYYTING